MAHTDRMSVDTEQGRCAVTAALTAVDAVPDAGPPPGTPGALTAVSFGQGLGAKGAAVVALLAGARRAGHLRRVRTGLEDARRSVERIPGADLHASDAVTAVTAAVTAAATATGTSDSGGGPR